MTMTESKVREILASLDTYIKTLNKFKEMVENARHTPPAATAEKRIARIEVEQDMALEPIQQEIMAKVDTMVQEEADYVASRKAAEILTLINGSSDYNTRLANAIKVIEILGDSMSAEQLQDVVDPFVSALEYSALRTLKAVAEKCCPHLFGIFANKVNFGPLPGDKLEFLKEFKVLVERCFQPDSAGDMAFTAGYIENKVNDYFGRNA